jgi:hypothetical protein
VADQNRVRLVIDVDANAEPIIGTLHDPRGGTVEFAGWLGLAMALERGMNTARPFGRRRRLRQPAVRHVSESVD